MIDFVLSHTLRLFHPFLPFITEELWHGMGYAEDMPENQGGKTIMFAPWPKPLDDDFKSHYGLTAAIEKRSKREYELVTQGRNLRRDGNIAANKKIKFILKPAGRVAALDAEVLKLLLNAETFEVDRELSAGKSTPTVRTDWAICSCRWRLDGQGGREGAADKRARKNRSRNCQGRTEA